MFRYSVYVTLMLLVAPALGEPLSKAKRGDWPMWGGSGDRNMVSGEKGIPSSWDVKAKKNLKWVAPLGSQTYGNPVIVQIMVNVARRRMRELREAEARGDGAKVAELRERYGMESRREDGGGDSEHKRRP